MVPKKLIKFLVSSEFYQLVEKTEAFLNFDPKIEWEKHRSILLLLDRYLRNRLSDANLQNFAKEIASFLSDEQRENLLNFINQNFFELREQFWNETPKENEEIEEENKEIEEEQTKESGEISYIPKTFEEKEKKYQELMAPFIQKQPSLILQEQETPSKTPEFKTITFEATEKQSLPKINSENTQTYQETLPETTIIIRKKEEKSEKKQDDTTEILDLSRL